MKAKLAILCERCKCRMEVSTNCTSNIMDLCCPNCGQHMPVEQIDLIFQALLSLDAVPASITEDGGNVLFTVSLPVPYEQG